MPEGFIPKYGGYRKLSAYQMSEIVHDATVDFCRRFVDKKSRTTDQMIQAARSGKQNIVEGSHASGLSKETEIKLMNVARASLEELLCDYQDYLRNHELKQWDKNSKEASFVRKLAANPDRSYKTYKTYIESRSDEVAANIILCVVNQTNFLLNRLIRELEKEFLEQGGLRERMTTARRKARGY